MPLPVRIWTTDVMPPYSFNCPDSSTWIERFPPKEQVACSSLARDTWFYRKRGRVAEGSALLRRQGAVSALTGSNPVASSINSWRGVKMDISSFGIWKFTEIEGYLQHMRPIDVNTTRYCREFSCAHIHYDYEAETARIVDGDNIVECKFSELADTLKRLGMYAELPENERHTIAGHHIIIPSN